MGEARRRGQDDHYVPRRTPPPALLQRMGRRRRVFLATQDIHGISSTREVNLTCSHEFHSSYAYRHPSSFIHRIPNDRTPARLTNSTLTRRVHLEPTKIEPNKPDLLVRIQLLFRVPHARYGAHDALACAAGGAFVASFPSPSSHPCPGSHL